MTTAQLIDAADTMQRMKSHPRSPSNSSHTMIHSAAKASLRRGISCFCCTASFTGIVLVLAFAMGQTACGDEQPQVSGPANRPIAAADEATVRKKVRGSRRAGRAVSDATPERRKAKRSSRGGRSRADRRSKQRPNKAEQAPIRLHLNGSFELNLGNDRGVRGEGTTIIELDQATTQRLRSLIGKQLEQAGPLAKDLLTVAAQLPQTLHSTAEILKLIADPDTQQNLRQVEQLLRLLQQSRGKLDTGS